MKSGGNFLIVMDLPSQHPRLIGNMRIDDVQVVFALGRAWKYTPPNVARREELAQDADQGPAVFASGAAVGDFAAELIALPRSISYWLAVHTAKPAWTFSVKSLFYPLTLSPRGGPGRLIFITQWKMAKQISRCILTQALGFTVSGGTAVDDLQDLIILQHRRDIPSVRLNGYRAEDRQRFGRFGSSGFSVSVTYPYGLIVSERRDATLIDS